MSRECRIEGCTCPPKPARRLCHPHYLAVRRARRRGELFDGDTQTTVDPWADVDMEAVQEITKNPRPALLSKPERILVTRNLTDQGMSGSQIARALGISRRSVERYRAVIRNM